MFRAQNVLGLAAAICVSLLLPFVVVTNAHAAPVTITNGVGFTDSAGNPLHGHGGGIIKVGAYYYWFGENRSPDNQFQHVSVYRSTDLRSWELRCENVLAQDPTPELKEAALWRPKVIYNARTGQYVMWTRKEKKPGDFGESRVGVATSSSVDGEYTYRGSFQPLGYRSYDMSVFRDDDGTAYLISTTSEQRDLAIFRLTPDYLGVAGPAPVTVLTGVKREAQAMFKRDGVYFLVTSGVTGWQPNQARYATATSIAGPWSAMVDLGDSITYGSQSAFVLPIQGSATTSYLYLGDRWAGAWNGAHDDSEYVWLPLRFPSTRSLSMSWHPRISIDTATGEVQGVGAGHAYEELRPRHSGKCLDVPKESAEDGTRLIQYACGTAANSNQHWQVRDLGTGYHQVIVRHSHKCLTVPSSSTEDGVQVSQRTCGAGENQQWRITNLGGGYFQILARHSGKCLDVAQGSTEDGARVVQYTCKDSPNQKWRRVGAPY